MFQIITSSRDKKWRIKANGTKSVNVTFSIRKDISNSEREFIKTEDAKYLGL
jgi:hypothetical protein